MRIKNVLLLLPIFSCLALLPSYSQERSAALCNKVVVGYWHSFDNLVSTVIKLRDVPCHYNVVDVAFLEGASPSDPTMVFRLDTVKVEKEKEFIEDVKILKKRGVKVIGSIGGANGVVHLPDATAKSKFVSSLIGLIDKYGFEGLDIDIESNVILGAGDSDFQNPTTPQLKNLISACKEIKTKYGSDFWITMAPEVAYVQGGITAYANIWGAYMPIIQGLRNELNFIHVQYYNTGGNQASDGNTYTSATADFIVAMNDMLLSGFKLGNGQMFPALRQDQVAFGLPAREGAAGSGVMPHSEVVKALDYLMKGISFNGKYKLSNKFPDLRGIMTWSVNWDNRAPSKYDFGKTFSQYFCGSTNLCDPSSGVDSPVSRSDFNLYPNPTSDRLFFDKQVSFDKINIYSFDGRLVKQIARFSGTEISTKELPQGMYSLELINKGAHTHQSFIKQ